MNDFSFDQRSQDFFSTHRSDRLPLIIAYPVIAAVSAALWVVIGWVL